MKNLLTYLVAVFLIGACTENPVVDEQISGYTFSGQRGCATMEVLDANLQADPRLKSRMEAIERHTQKFIENHAAGRTSIEGKITIPVVVNVLYRTNEENISDEQIYSQIQVLNEDFNKLNADVSDTPEEFAAVVADYEIEFVLQAINRKQSSKKQWPLNDGMKKAKQGGIAPTDPEHTLNIWVVNRLVAWVIGYAQFPGGNPATDGIVVVHNCFGTTGTLHPRFNKGRTATHEVGHWLNLRHIWGDATCGNDFVNDTPVHRTSNFNCPDYPKEGTCLSIEYAEMTMNYMDYTDDACMFMFTEGQKVRSRAIFDEGGDRHGFLTND